jgi:carbamoyltransferase
MANGRIERDLGVRLYVQPAAGDAGGSLGAALFYHHCIYGGTRVRPLNHAYLGQAWSMEACEKALKKTQLHRVRHMPNEEALVTEVARLLAEGAVIGWFHGRFEWGPRALGARSILADPRRANMKSLVNEKIKFREPFRPFAPSVLAHRAGEFFALPPDRFPLSPEDFMLSVSPVHEAKRDQIPAVTHVDNTSRVQLVRSDTNPRYHALIESFDRITGIPMVLNTSFNRRGEPIVASPEDAIETFLWTELDYLVLEELIVSKEG